MLQDYNHLRPGLVKKIDDSIALLRKAESLALRYNPSDGFYLAFSGGKDSQCLYHVAQLADVRFKAHFSPTTVDPPQLISFIRATYKDVAFNKVTKSIYQAAVEKKILPTMRVRWCCAEFKEKSGAGNVVLTGVRHQESAKRSKRNEVEVTGHKFSGDIEAFSQWQEQRIRKQYKHLNQDQFAEAKQTEVRCIGGKDKIIISPLLDWTEHDVWDFLNGMQIPHCSLYDNGYRRIGCILCPMSQYKHKVREIHDFPYVKEKWLQAIMQIRGGGYRRTNTLPSDAAMDCRASTWPTTPCGGQKRINRGLWAGFRLALPTMPLSSRANTPSGKSQREYSTGGFPASHIPSGMPTPSNN